MDWLIDWFLFYSIHHYATNSQTVPDLASMSSCEPAWPLRLFDTHSHDPWSTFLLSGTKKHSRLYFLSPGLESAISPRRNVFAKYAHCYWHAIISKWCWCWYMYLFPILGSFSSSLFAYSQCYSPRVKTLVPIVLICRGLEYKQPLISCYQSLMCTMNAFYCLSIE